MSYMFIVEDPILLYEYQVQNKLSHHLYKILFA